MQRRPKVSIITVAYKAQKELFNCLEGLSETNERIVFETIVVDNNEKPGLGPRLKRKFPKVKYVKSSGNIGFSAGNNFGAKEANGEYLFFLNPDTKVLPGALQILTRFLDSHPKVAIVSPMLLDSKLTPYEFVGTETLTPARAIFGLSFLNKIFPNNPVSRKFWLKDRKKDKPFEVGVVPGSALMIRRTIFNALGGFDENFFLYFEESDLCKRASDAGFKSWILPAAKVVHLWEKSTTKGEKIDRIFAQSRFYYFRKHYGVFWAAVVDTVCGFSKWHATVLAILVLGAFLHFYRLPQNLVFHGELGHNYLAIKNAFETKTIPLLGPPTSHPWLSFGPLFYWIFGPILALFKFNPIAGSYFFALVETLLIFVNWLVIKKFFGTRAAAISSFFIAISPAWVRLTWEARFFSLAALFFYPFFYFLVENRLFPAGLFLGVMFNFHLSPIILFLPTALYIYLNRRIFSKSKIVLGLIGFGIPNIPFLIYNFGHNFEMLKNLLIWIPYRIAGFVGLYPKNNVSMDVLKHNIFSLYEFVGGMFSSDVRALSLTILFIVLAFVGISLFWQYRARQKNWPLLVLILFFIFGYLGIFVVGDAPSHYYMPIYPLPIIFFSLFLAKSVGGKILNVSILLILAGFLFINFGFYFSSKWFYVPKDKINEDFPVPYAMQLAAARSIVNDAVKKPFTLQRVGPYDYFEGDYAQNYRYLLWWQGNEPVDNAKTKYTIYETKLPDKISGKIIYQKDGLAVLKEQNGK